MSKVEEGFSKASSRDLPKISVEMLIDFLKSDDAFRAPELRGVKQSRSSREEYGDAAIGYVQLKRDLVHCSVKGRICPEHKIRKKPYNVTLKVNEEENRVDSVQCHDCAASEGGCKHAIAFLMWCHRRSEEPSPTEVISYWSKPRLASSLEETKFLRVSNFGSTSSVTLPDCSTFLREVIEASKQKNVNSVLYETVVLTPIESSEKLSLHYLSRMFFSSIEAEHINAENFMTYCTQKMSHSDCQKGEKLTLEQSQSPLWYELRYGRVTASLAHSASVCTTDGSLVHQILGAHNSLITKAMVRGNALEKEVIKAASLKLKEKIFKCGLQLLPEYPLLGASADGLGKDFTVEVKCPSKVQTIKNYVSDSGEIKKHVKAQMQMQMLFYKKEKSVLCLASPTFEEDQMVQCYWEKYDAEYVNRILAKILCFWKFFIFDKLKVIYT